MFNVKRYIKYDAERTNQFAEDIKTSPGGENIDKCIQCGTCSGACPLSIYMDYTPRNIIELTRAGWKDDVLSSFTIWLCASCYACSSECPKKIEITDIMYTLKRRAIEEGLYPRKFPIPILAREFFKMVRKRGMISELWLVATLFMKTKILKAFSMMNLGFGIMRTGRLTLKKESMKNPKELTKLLDTVIINKDKK